ncbi:MAG: AarF/UbiB family protein [Verrucomicrobiota bacterium]|nr:AarF/UbiB family protein [Verrucomicrobiota bacterium]
MSFSFKPQHLKRYKDIAFLLLKYGNADMVGQFGLRAALTEDELSPKNQGTPPEQLADDLEKMGPTFVKLGQILSSRADLLPAPYLNALTRLQDKVKPFSYEEVEAAITNELGVRLSKAFSEFEREPTAAASLGQVHKAKLRDGRSVVVKIQRPNIRKIISDDLEVLEELTSFFDKHSEVARRYQLVKIFEEFQRTLISELDYHREAANLKSVGDNLKEFERIVVPQPVHDYTARAILTMDFVAGKKLTEMSPLERLDLDGATLADELFKAYLKQVLVDGIFHADPHPGNIFLTSDKKVALLDLGMVGRTTPIMQDHLIKLLIAISEGNGEESASLAIKMSETTSYFNETDFRRKIASLVVEHQSNTLEKIDVGRLILEIGRGAGQTGLYVPVELTMLGKTLLQLDQIGRSLNEKFDPNEAVRRHVSEILNCRLQKDITPGKLFASVLELKDFVTHLPTRINKVLDTVGNSEVELKIKVVETHLFLEGFQKVANRITAGLILAALIVGAALLMRVETAFKILGYPGLAMLCFMAAGGLGFWLVVSILFTDYKTKNKQRRKP